MEYRGFHQHFPPDAARVLAPGCSDHPLIRIATGEGGRALLAVLTSMLYFPSAVAAEPRVLVLNEANAPPYSNTERTGFFDVVATEAFRGRTVGVIRGWKVYESALAGAKGVTTVDDPDQLFRLLQLDRIEVALYERLMGLDDG